MCFKVLSASQPIDHLNEDFPELANYLRSVLSTPLPASALAPPQPSQYQQDIASEHLTSELMASVQNVIQTAELDGRDPEEELRQVVGRAVLEGVVTGFQMTTDDADPQSSNGTNGTPAKKAKTDDSSAPA